MQIKKVGGAKAVHSTVITVIVIGTVSVVVELVILEGYRQPNDAFH